MGSVLEKTRSRSSRTQTQWTSASWTQTRWVIGRELTRSHSTTPKSESLTILLVPAGVHPDHVRGAVLRHLRNEGPHHLLRQELQPPPFRLLHPLHAGRTGPRRPAWAVQTQEHPDHLPRLPVHQDAHQHHPQGGGADEANHRVGVVVQGKLFQTLCVNRLSPRPSRWR